MLSRRWLCAALIFAGLLPSVAISADLSIGFYLKDPQVHFYKLTEEKLQAFDKATRRVYSLKISDPIVKALSKKVPHNAPIGQLVQILEATPLKPLVESCGLTVRDWLIIQIVLKATKAADAYYEETKKFPGSVTTTDNLAFYMQHKPEIEKMVAEWSKLLSHQMQEAQPIKPPAPKNN